jgi:hypothetical protein
MDSRHPPQSHESNIGQGEGRVAIRLLCSQMTIEELHADIVSISGFWNVGVLKETVEESLPDVQFRVDAQLHELRVGVDRRTHFKRPRARDDQSRRKLCEYFWRIIKQLYSTRLICAYRDPHRRFCR